MAAGASEGTTHEPPLQCMVTSTAGVDPFAGELSCSTYLDVEWDSPQIQTRIVNDTDQPIVVTNWTIGCGQPSRRFDFVGTMGGRAMAAGASVCADNWDACASYAEGADGCLLCGTLYPDIYIAPGGWFSEPWDAWLKGAVVMPGVCVDHADDLPCFAAVPLAAGTFTATAHAMLVDLEDSACRCQPDEFGSCAIEGGCNFVETSTASAVHDGVCETLEIVFAAGA